MIAWTTYSGGFGIDYLYLPTPDIDDFLKAKEKVERSIYEICAVPSKFLGMKDRVSYNPVIRTRINNGRIRNG